MADAITKVSDLIIPEIFNPYLIEKTTHKNAFINSGIATSDPSINISNGGTTIQIPFFKKTGAKASIMTEGGTGIETKNITASKSVAAVHAQQLGFAVTDLAKHFSGADPMAAIADELAVDWSQTFTGIALASLEGIMGLSTMADSVLAPADAVLTADLMADASYLLGDAYDQINCLAMHSAVLAKLKKLELIDWVQPSEMSMGYFQYMGKRVIVDDDIAPTDGVFPIYFFGAGALAYNETADIATIEYVRNAKMNQDEVYSRRIYTMHPRGMKWKGSPVGISPTEAELKTSSNWELAAERKNVPICMLKARVTAKTTG